MNRNIRCTKILFNFIILVFKMFGIIASSIPIYKILDNISLSLKILLCILFLGFLMSIIINIYNMYIKEKTKEFGNVYKFKIILYTSLCFISIYLFLMEPSYNYPLFVKNDVYILCSIIFLELIILGILNIIFCLFTNENDDKILPF